ncbi:hypothetical protein MHU86_23892 [Fragilaria crotonensis]|nr:hypothetical protein MHU86_23892 [Fragilaria crotonensis]
MPLPNSSQNCMPTTHQHQLHLHYETLAISVLFSLFISVNSQHCTLLHVVDRAKVYEHGVGRRLPFDLDSSIGLSDGAPPDSSFPLWSMPSFQENSGIMINTKQPSTELHVAFDVTSGKDHLVADQEEVEELPPIIDGDDTLQACQPPVDTHAQVLRLLETLAEREARDVDIMLSGLALAVVVLLGIYGWTVHTVAKKLSTVKIIKNEAMIATQRTNLPPARSTTTSASTVDTATRRSKNRTADGFSYCRSHWRQLIIRL